MSLGDWVNLGTFLFVVAFYAVLRWVDLDLTLGEKLRDVRRRRRRRRRAASAGKWS